MNTFCFSGNVCKDIELRMTTSGKQVASFSIAINEGKDKTEFVNCVAWEKTAELLNQYVKKGDRLSGTGRIQTRKWEDQQGNTKYATECVVTQFDFPPKRNDGPTAQEPFRPADEMEDEIPW
ncbi:MAG: single-stranded DNA-binding protein [Gammaproteobacteria bacterium]|nr:single-stranded DNA-binding protein [Gammaproteobacteria bacterium]